MAGAGSGTSPIIRHGCDAAGRHEIHGIYAAFDRSSGGCLGYLLYGRVGPGIVSRRAYVGLRYVFTEPGHRGKGTASALLDRLYRDNRDADVSRGLATEDGAAWLAAYDGRPLRAAAQIGTTEEETGGTRWPRRVRLIADHARHGEVGRLVCYLPRRRPGRVLVDELYVPPGCRRQGMASMLMDALLSCYPGAVVRLGEAPAGGRAWWRSYSARSAETAWRPAAAGWVRPAVIWRGSPGRTEMEL